MESKSGLGVGRGGRAGLELELDGKKYMFDIGHLIMALHALL